MPDPKIAQLGQYLVLEAVWKDNEGNQIFPVDGELPTWVCDRTNVVTCVASTDNPGMADCRAVKTGDAVVTATAHFDVDGVVKPGSLTVPLSVVEDYTPAGEIVVRYGSVVPMDKKKG